MIQSSSNTFSFCHPQILYDLVDLTNGNGMKFNCTKSNTSRPITITFAMRWNLIIWSWLFHRLWYAGDGWWEYMCGYVYHARGLEVMNQTSSNPIHQHRWEPIKEKLQKKSVLWSTMVTKMKTPSTFSLAGL